LIWFKFNSTKSNSIESKPSWMWIAFNVFKFNTFFYSNSNQIELNCIQYKLCAMSFNIFIQMELIFYKINIFSHHFTVTSSVEPKLSNLFFQFKNSKTMYVMLSKTLAPCAKQGVGGEWRRKKKRRRKRKSE
jgi:hypothetical protein